MNSQWLYNKLFFSVHSARVGFGCFQPRTLGRTDIKCANGDFEEANGTSRRGLVYCNPWLRSWEWNIALSLMYLCHSSRNFDVKNFNYVFGKCQFNYYFVLSWLQVTFFLWLSVQWVISKSKIVKFWHTGIEN